MRKKEVRWSPGKGEKEKVSGTEGMKRKEGSPGTLGKKTRVEKKESQETF